MTCADVRRSWLLSTIGLASAGLASALLFSQGCSGDKGSGGGGYPEPTVGIDAAASDLPIAGEVGTTDGAAPAAANWRVYLQDQVGDIMKLWGDAPNNIWGAAADGRIIQFDGVDWASVGRSPYGALNAVWGFSSTDIWVGGAQGVLHRQEAGEWIPGDTGEDGPVLSIWGRSQLAVWIVGDFGFAKSHLLFFDGANFDISPDYAPNTPRVSDDPRAVWGTAANDAWTVGTGAIYHWDGTYWQVSPTPEIRRTGLYDVWGRSANDVWAVGDRQILHWDGQRWTDIPQKNSLYNTFNGVWASGPNDVWVVGANGYILRGGVNGFASVPSDTTRHLFAIWGSSPTAIWAVGEGGLILRYENQPPPPPPDGGACQEMGEDCSVEACCGTLICIRLSPTVSACG